MTPIYYNDSGFPSLQGATNHNLKNADGVCIAASFIELGPGEPWTGTAADVVSTAGRRAEIPPPVAPALSPPVNKTANDAHRTSCVRFAARRCDAARQSQKWLLSPGVEPGDGQPTNVKSAIERNATCWQAQNGGFGTKISCDFDNNVNGAHGGCTIPGPAGKPGGDACRPLPNASALQSMGASCEGSQAFRFNKNGTIALALTRSNKDNNGNTHYLHHCLQVLDKFDPTDSDPVLTVGLADCAAAASTAQKKSRAPAAPNQQWTVESNSDGTITIKQGSLCVDNNYIADPQQ